MESQISYDLTNQIKKHETEIDKLEIQNVFEATVLPGERRFYDEKSSLIDQVKTLKCVTDYTNVESISFEPGLYAELGDLLQEILDSHQSSFKTIDDPDN